VREGGKIGWAIRKNSPKLKAEILYKYYVAYKLQVEAREAARKAREQVAPGISK
jgi:hypothetical protein